MTQNDLKGFRFRESTRAPFETEVRLRFDRFGGAVSGFAADISMEGMFVRTPEPKPVGTLVQFEFKLGAASELIQGLGDVVWVRTRQLAPNKPPGMGVQFRYVDPHSRELIFKIVDSYLKEAKGGDEDGSAEGAEAPPAAAGTAPEGDAGAPPLAQPAVEGLGTASQEPPPPSLQMPGMDDALQSLEGLGPGFELEASSTADESLPSPGAATEQFSLPTEAPPPLVEPDPPPAIEAPVVPDAAPVPEPPPVQAPPATPTPIPPVAQDSQLPSFEQLPQQAAVPDPGPPPAAAEPPPAGESGGSARSELFVPDEVWDPVAAAAQAMERPEDESAVHSRPSLSYSAGAGAAARGGGGRSRALLLVLALVLAGVAAGLFFSDQLRDLLPLPGGDGDAPPPEVASATGIESGGVAGSGEATDPVPPSAAGGENSSAAGTEGEQDEPFAAPLPEPISEPGEPGRQTPVREPEPSLRSGARRIVEIRTAQGRDETVATIAGDGSIDSSSFEQSRLESPPRILIRIYGIEEAYRSRTSVGSPQLKEIRTGLHSDALHVVFDLASPDVVGTVSAEGGLLRVRLSG